MARPAILYDAYVDSTAITATSTLTGTLATDALVGTEDNYHSPASTADYSYTFDFGANVTVDAIALVGSYLDGVTLEVRGSDDDFAASDVAILAEVALSAPANAAWSPFASSTYRYFKVLISGHSTAIKISHINLCAALEVPYFEEDPDQKSITTDSSFLVSPSGRFFGATHNRSMRDLNMNFGDVTVGDIGSIETFVDKCITNPRSFFLVPDSGAYSVYFGWSESKFKAPYNGGMYTVGAMTFKTRAV